MSSSSLRLPTSVFTPPPITPHLQPCRLSMRSSLLRLAQHRTPLIKFLGKRSAPTQVDHTPHLHPADPHPSLPDSFAESFVSYREQVQNPGATSNSASSTPSTSGTPQQRDGPPKLEPNKPYGLIGGKSGKDLGPVAAPEGEYFSRSELPRRFQPLVWEDKEIDAVNSGGASFYP